MLARLAAALGTAIDKGFAQVEAIHAAVDAVYAEFRARGAGQDGPLYAWPIAAMSWIRRRASGHGHRLELYCLGDCKVLMRTPGGAIEDLEAAIEQLRAHEGLRAQVRRAR